MAHTLNEDILRLIFDYLPSPLEWIQVSQVCKLWRSAASKQWRKIQEINYLDDDAKRELKIGKDDKTPVISTETAEKIFYFAASFVKVLSRCEYFDRTELRLLVEQIDETVKFIKFGPFVYKLKHFDDYKALKLLAQNSTSITEIRFDKEPRTDSLKLFFKNNKIKKIVISNFNNFYDYIPTDDIEELVLGFSDDEQIETYSGRFPNLKNLELVVSFKNLLMEPQEAVSLILPHFIGVPSLRLELRTWSQTKVSCKAFMDIAKLTQLEHLAISIPCTHVEAAGFFFTKLAKRCPKLRSMELPHVKVNEKQLRTLLTEFRLEKLTVNRVTYCQSVELPESINLSELKMKYDTEKLNITNFCNALKKMPKLETLEMKVDREALYKSFRHGVLKGNETSNLVCEVATVAAFHNKNMMVEEISDRENFKKLKILRKDAASHGLKTEDTLKVVVGFRYDKKLAETVKMFVRDNLTNYDFAVEGEED